MQRRGGQGQACSWPVIRLIALTGAAVEPWVQWERMRALDGASVRGRRREQTLLRLGSAPWAPRMGFTPRGTSYALGGVVVGYAVVRSQRPPLPCPSPFR